MGWDIPCPQTRGCSPQGCCRSIHKFWVVRAWLYLLRPFWSFDWLLIGHSLQSCPGLFHSSDSCIKGCVEGNWLKKNLLLHLSLENGLFDHRRNRLHSMHVCRRVARLLTPNPRDFQRWETGLLYIPVTVIIRIPVGTQNRKPEVFPHRCLWYRNRLSQLNQFLFR